jgi:protein phosphatase 1 regulatory subunit 7
MSRKFFLLYHTTNTSRPSITVDMAGEEDTPNGNGHTNGTSPKPSTPQSRSGWDGRLRVNKQATLANPEALGDPDYSDEDAPPVDQIDADEGTAVEGRGADVWLI